MADHAIGVAPGDIQQRQRAAKRAMDAMMTMRKIDIAAIEAAVRG